MFTFLPLTKPSISSTFLRSVLHILFAHHDKYIASRQARDRDHIRTGVNAFTPVNQNQPRNNKKEKVRKEICKNHSDIAIVEVL